MLKRKSKEESKGKDTEQPKSKFKTDAFFWNLANEARMNNHCSNFLIQDASQDFTDALRKRALSFLQDSMAMNDKAWAHFFEMNPSIDRAQDIYQADFSRKEVFIKGPK